MTNSKGSVVVGDEGSQCGLIGVVVVPDRGGEREDALEDSGGDTADGAAAVSFEIELALERVVDRFDELTQRFEEPGAGTWRFVFAGRSQETDAVMVEEPFELGGDVALVRDEGLAGAAGEEFGFALEEIAGDVAFVGLGVGEREGDRQPDGGADQMEA